MLRKLLHRLLLPHHPWRHVSFTTLSEMYIAGFLKQFAQGLIGVFIPLYLLSKGFEFSTIFIYYASLYAWMLPIDVISASVTARLGPKHVMRIGFFLQFITALLLSQISKLPAPILVVSFFHACAAGFYWLPYHVDFSKVKHNEHSGKELGWLQLMERLGGIIGPLAGGLLATLFGGSILFYSAAVILACAIIVLMFKPEPIQTKQKLNFKGLFQRNDWRNTLSYVAFVSENSISIALWPTYLAAVIFASGAYLKIGTVASVSIAVAVIVALPLGTLLDKQNGLRMLRLGTIFNAIIHILRNTVHSFFGVIGIAVLNEPNTLVYRLAYLKGFYDSADDYPGQRIAYITKSEVIAHCFCLVMWSTFAALAFLISRESVFVVGFSLAAVLSLLIQLQQYKALR